jgi:hypothetical protein
MTRFFHQNHLKIFDFAAVFTPVTEQIKANAEQIARAKGITIEYIRKSGAFRKEDRIQEILKERGEAEGLVHIFSVMEINVTYKPWYDKATGKCFFKKVQTKCLNYYFYFIDRQFGLCFLKVPTIAPYRVTFYFNGHNRLAGKLDTLGIGYKKLDNAFVAIDDFRRAQELSDKIRVEDLHQGLDIIVSGYCLLPEEYGMRFNYTIHQVEYAMDILFKDAAVLQPVYENIIKTAMRRTLVRGDPREYRELFRETVQRII